MCPQSQLSAERLNVESLQRSLTKAEEEARGLRKELDDLRYKHNLPTPHKHVISASVAHAPASAGMGKHSHGRKLMKFSCRSLCIYYQ